MLNRRDFLSGAGTLGVAAALPGRVSAQSAQAQDFDFLFITDTHLQPELDAAHGCDMAFKKARNLRAEFAVQGGDHVFDALGVPKEKALSLFDLYDKTQQDLGMKVYHTIGNHDCFGVYPASGVAPTDPMYGKRYYEDHVGKLYYGFEHKGVRFFVLDSVAITADRSYEGRVDAAQLAWLQQQLSAMPAGSPVIVVSHIPLVTAFASYVPVPAVEPPHHGMSVANSDEVIKLFEGHNVLGVLQGHTHVNERVEWRGVPYITGGAVCGNWWKGVRMGTPEGFTVVSLRGGKLTTRYETYGFKSVAPENG